MSFADFSLFAIADVEGVLNGPAVTVSLNGDFCSFASVGDVLECTGQVVKSGKSMLFVRGMVTNKGEPIFPFSGVIKRLGKSAL
jgi:acyl-coenzyme A thioesterase PaaI-like protein